MSDAGKADEGLAPIAEPEQIISIFAKSAVKGRFPFSIPISTTIQQLKANIAEKVDGYSQDKLRLIYSGKVLTDESTLADINAVNGTVIMFMKVAEPKSNPKPTPAATATTAPASTAPTTLPSAVGGPNALSDFASRFSGGNPPAFMLSPEMLTRSLDDPQFRDRLRAMMASPEIQQMIQGTQGPGGAGMMQSLLEDPDMREMLTDPNLIRQLLSAAGGASNLLGGGQSQPPRREDVAHTLDALRRVTGHSGVPTANPRSSLPEAPFGISPGAPGNAANDMLLQQLLGSMIDGEDDGSASNYDLLASMGLAQGLPASRAGGAGANTGANTGSQQQLPPPEERFATQLALLADMGLNNRAENLQVLIMMEGDVEQAANYLWTSRERDY